MNLKSGYLPTRCLFDTLSDSQIGAYGGKSIVLMCCYFQINYGCRQRPDVESEFVHV
jgi:hypothetical protein